MEARNEWKDAVIDALVIGHIYTNDHENDPRKAIHDLINWEIAIALDPLVSSDAQALIDDGRSQVYHELDMLGKTGNYVKRIREATERAIQWRDTWINASAEEYNAVVDPYDTTPYDLFEMYTRPEDILEMCKYIEHLERKLQS